MCFFIRREGEALVHPDPLLAPPGSARRKSGELAVDEKKKIKRIFFLRGASSIFFENTASSRENKAGYIYIGKAALKKNIFFFIPISGGRDFVYFSIFRRALALLKNLQALI